MRDLAGLGLIFYALLMSLLSIALMLLSTGGERGIYGMISSVWAGVMFAVMYSTFQATKLRKTINDLETKLASANR